MADPDNTLPIPVDLVTASASGLDPDITPAAALYQVARVARARHLDPVKLREMVLAQVKGPQWGVFGESRVNVLMLNLSVDGAR
jgi:potassium-transporting ATPase KdpC subunit